MKRLSLKQLLVMVFVGLLTMSGSVFGDDFLGISLEDDGCCGTGEHQHQNRNGGRDLELFGDGCCGTGEHRNRNGQDKDVSLTGDGCCGTGEHQNQNRNGGKD